MPEFPEAPLTGITELRIHGVSGTPVEQMLQHPHPVQVSGDKLAGFYRRGSADDPETPEARPAQRLEAYSWGRLTAGASARALWLLLLPFALVNVASWAHPARPGRRFPPVGTMSALLRLLALTITGTLVLGTASISLDVLAWQCGNDAARCASEHWYTSFLAEGIWARAGVRIALGAAVPVLVVEALRRLSKSTAEAYEDYAVHTAAADPPSHRVAHASDGGPLPGVEPAPEPEPGDGGDSCGARDLARPRFWAGGKPLRRLRALHTGAAFAGIAALVAYAVRHGGHRQRVGDVIYLLSLGVLGLASAMALSHYSGRRRALLEEKEPPRWACLAFEVVGWGGLALVVAALVYALGYDSDGLGGAVPGLHGAIDLLLRAQIALLAALLLANLWALLPFARTFGQSLAGRPMFAGFTEWVLALLGLTVAGAYVSGVAFRVADYLGAPFRSDCVGGCEAPGQDTAFMIPPQYYWAGRAFAIASGAAFVGGVVLLVLRRVRAPRFRDRVRAEYGIAPGTDEDRVRTIAKAQQAAAMTDRADLALAGILVTTLAGVILLWNVDERLGEDALGPLTTVGTWLVSFFALGVVALGRSAYRSESLRRSVGILWDLATFWPRAAHPFAPPCYCERTVPELRRRIGRLAAAGGDVVVSAHSQGTVIAAAAMLQLDDAERARVALLTYGSPLDRLYARAFPHYFGTDTLRRVDAAVAARWRNLFRRSDPIGGPVFERDTGNGPAGPHDRRFTDPAFEKDSYEFGWPRTRGHSDYPHDPRFAQTVTELARLLRPRSRTRVNPPAPAGIGGDGRK